MNCKCPCGCPIWSSQKSNRLICRHCEAEKHTGVEEETKMRKGRQEGKKVRCDTCMIPVHIEVVDGRRVVVHDKKFYLWNLHEVTGAVVR